MSGFFPVRRSCPDLVSLHPQGFMLLLELIVHCPQATVTEVPYTFGSRHPGVSKAGIKEGVTYLSRLARLEPNVSGSAEAAAPARPGSKRDGRRWPRSTPIRLGGCRPAEPVSGRGSVSRDWGARVR